MLLTSPSEKLQRSRQVTEDCELDGEELKTEILKAMKEYIAAEMLKQGYTVEDLIRIEKEALDSLRKKKTRRDPDAGAFVGSLF